MCWQVSTLSLLLDHFLKYIYIRQWYCMTVGHVNRHSSFTVMFQEYPDKESSFFPLWHGGRGRLEFFFDALRKRCGENAMCETVTFPDAVYTYNFSFSSFGVTVKTASAKVGTITRKSPYSLTAGLPRFAGNVLFSQGLPYWISNSRMPRFVRNYFDLTGNFIWSHREFGHKNWTARELQGFFKPGRKNNVLLNTLFCLGALQPPPPLKLS